MLALHRPVTAVVVACLLASTAVAPLAGATPTPRPSAELPAPTPETESAPAPAVAATQSSDGTAAVVVHATVTLTDDGLLRVRLRFTGAETDRVRLYGVSGMTVEDADGYTETAEGDWDWSAATPRTPPSFSYTVDPGASRYNDVGDGWAFANLDHTITHVWTPTEVETRPVAPDGRVAGDAVLFGAYEVAHATGADGNVTVVQSTGVRDSVDVEETATTLARVTTSLNVSPAPQDTTMIVVPGSYSGPYGTAPRGSSTMMIRGDAVWDGLMTHEYLHTRQTFDPTSEMSWIIEGSAFYYMALVPYQDGTMSWERFEDRVAPESRYQLAVTENETYIAAATRGKSVAAALDRRIRVATNNTRTLSTVYRRLNEQDEVDYAAFRETVVGVAGPSVGAWLDEHVDGDGELDAPTPGEFVPTTTAVNTSDAVFACTNGTWSQPGDEVRTDDRLYLGYAGWSAFDVQADGRVERTQDTPCGVLPGDERDGRRVLYAVTPEGNDTVEVRLSTAYDADASEFTVVRTPDRPTTTATASDGAGSDATATGTSDADADAGEGTGTAATTASAGSVAGAGDANAAEDDPGSVPTPGFGALAALLACALLAAHRVRRLQ